jgi:opacity protein-like surface antigen
VSRPVLAGAGKAALALALLAAAPAALAQTMLDQEQRLIEIHSLLVALPALEPPGALAPLQGRLGLEVITVPVIDGTTGGKTQLTASHFARAFPRLRAALGLPLGGSWRTFAGLGYIPPVKVNQVSSNMLGLEAGAAWTGGPLSAGLRLHGEWADSRSPVTDPATRDRLVTRIGGADLSAAWRLGFGDLALTPYASVGVAGVDGTFTVTSDGHQLRSKTTNLALSAGARLLILGRLELVAELVAYPGALVHPALSVAWLPGGAHAGEE